MAINDIFESIKSGSLTTESYVDNFKFYTNIKKENEGLSFVQYTKMRDSLIQISKYKVNSLEINGNIIKINIEDEKGIKYETGYYFNYSGQLMILNSNKSKTMSERRCCLADIVEEDFSVNEIAILNKENGNAYLNGKAIFHIDPENNPTEDD